MWCMPYEERSPKPLCIEELTLLHDLAADTDADSVANLIMEHYWLRRIATYPIEEFSEVTIYLEMYDLDWKCLNEAGVPSLSDDDPRIKWIDDCTNLPVPTNFRPSLLFSARSDVRIKFINEAKAKLAESQQRSHVIADQMIESVGLERVNKALLLLGIEVNELGEPRFFDVESEQLEGVRRVVRLMSQVYRDEVRLNLEIMEPDDVEAIEGTGIEGEQLRLGIAALRKAMGLEE